MHIRPEDIATWLRNSAGAAGADGLVVSLNAGAGSVVAARVSQMAMEERVIAGVPADGALTDAAREAQRIVEGFQLRVLRLPVDLTTNRLAAALSATLTASAGRLVTADREWDRMAGLRQRVQMTAAYFVADSLNYLVAGSLDRTDLTIGSFTRHGDSAADLLPLGNLLKREVLELAADLEIPRTLIDQTRAESLAARDAYYSDTGLSHGDLERYLADGPDAVAPAAALKIERLMRAGERRRGPALLMDIE